IQALARGILQHVGEAGGAGAGIDGENGTAGFGVAIVLEHANDGQNVDGFGRLQQHLVGGRGSQGTGGAGTEARGEVGAIAFGCGADAGGGGGGGQKLRGDGGAASTDVADGDHGRIDGGGDTALIV